MDAVAEDPCADFFERAESNFHSLSRHAAAAVHHYRVAGLKLKIEVAKGQFEHFIGRALAHLETVPSGNPDFTICAWDSESTGLAPLRPAWPKQSYDVLGLVAGFNDSRFHTAVQPDPPILRMIDRQNRKAIYWTPAVRDLPYWETGAPLRPLLHEWLRSMDCLPVHGGAVGTKRGAVFLAGAGGSGKSNVALACATAGMFYASDDFCVLTRDPEWQVHSLYATGKVAGSDLIRHPHIAGHVSNAAHLDHEKALLFLNEIYPDAVMQSMPVRALLLPQVAGSGRSEIVEARPADAQRAIAMSTIELSRWTAATTFAEVARFVRERPAYKLTIGGDFEAVPDLIRDFITRFPDR